MTGLQNIAERLAEVNKVLAESRQGNGLTFAKAEILGRFYCDYEDTNRLVKEAMNMAEDDAKGLLKFASSLSSEVGRFNSIGTDNLKSINFENIFNAHIAPWKERHEEAMKSATELWRSYTGKSNHLDYVPRDSEEYWQLDAECDTAKAEYDQAHERANQLYNDLKEEERRYYCVYFFKPLFLEVLVSKLKAIAASIIADLQLTNEQGR